jgi:hypothetical protein
VELNGGKSVDSAGKNSRESFLSPSDIFCSVDAQWITAKKDWREHKKQYKEKNGKRYPTAGVAPSTDALNGSEDSGEYQKDMDEMRCILYAHGGLITVLCGFIRGPDVLGRRRILFWICRPGKIRHSKICSQNQRSCVR